MRNIALIGDLKAVRQFLSKLKKYQTSVHQLCYEIGTEKVLLTPLNQTAKLENSAAVIWFLSEKNKHLNQQCVEIIKKLPKEVHLDSYFSQSDEEDPLLFLSAILNTLPKIELQRKAWEAQKERDASFSFSTFYKWGRALFLSNNETSRSSTEKHEASDKFNKFVPTK